MLDNITFQQKHVAYFQYDGCPAHFALIVKTWLDAHYPQRWIGRNVSVAWTPRSTNLTCLKDSRCFEEN